MQAYARTDIGQVRAVNQDVCFCSTSPVGPLPNLFIVADGMGGHQAGDYASRYAIETFVDYVKAGAPGNLVRVVDAAVKTANLKVYRKSKEEERLAGMGTTMVAAFVEGTQLYAANVGDSRLYLIGSEINQVTEDHSYVAAMVRAGEISAEEARFHPEKNVITRAVGVAPSVKADFFEVDLAPGDKILMCSDGLSNMLSDERMFEIISRHDPHEAADLLIEEANANGGLDNITALIIEPGVKEADQ